MGTIENLEKQMPKKSEVVCDLMATVTIIMLLRFSSDAVRASAWASMACVYDPTLHDSVPSLLLEHILWAITKHLKIARSLLSCDHYIDLNTLLVKTERYRKARTKNFTPKSHFSEIDTGNILKIFLETFKETVIWFC